LAAVAREIRAAVENLLACDHEPKALGEALVTARALRESLDGPPGRSFWDEYPSPPATWFAMREHSLFGGQSHPLSAPMEVNDPGEAPGHYQLRATVSLGIAYQGWKGFAHGGYLAGLFDQVLGLAQGPRSVGAATKSLTVRYHRPTPLWQQLTFGAWYEDLDERTLLGHATCHVGETLTAEAEGSYRKLRTTDLAAHHDRSRGLPEPR